MPIKPEGPAQEPQFVVVKQSLFGRWIIAHGADERYAWSGSRWVPIGGEVQVCNFADAGEAGRYVESWIGHLCAAKAPVPAIPAPGQPAGAEEWLLSKDYEMFLSSHIGMSGKLLCDTLEAFAAHQLQALRDQNVALRRAVGILGEALSLYGHHEPSCAYRPTRPGIHGIPCDCGLHKAARAGKESQ